MSKSKRRFPIFFVEGETEKYLIEDFKKIHKDPIKRIVKINLWNNDVSKILPGLTEVNDIVIIFDTDHLDGIERFNKNIDIILSRKHRVHLFQQTSNFEHELMYSCKCTQKKLLDEFCKKIVSVDNFKSSFIKCNSRFEKLAAIGFSKEKMWSRGFINELVHREIYKSKYFDVI